MAVCGRDPGHQGFQVVSPPFPLVEFLPGDPTGCYSSREYTRTVKGDAQPGRPWIVRFLVVLTVLLCLGTGSCVWEARCAERIASRLVEQVENRQKAMAGTPSGDFDWSAGFWSDVVWEDYLQHWRLEPWYGRRGDQLFFKCHREQGYEMRGELMSVSMDGVGWVPRRSYPALLRKVTGADLPNDPAAWEAWFQAHPRLVWDPKQRRLVDKP